MSTDIPAYRLPGNYGKADPTPAPFDPSKAAITLKGGDYIEAESDGTKIGGKVSHVTERGFVAIEHLGEFAIHQITASPQADRYRFFILTDHQPAPKPEWKPGTSGTATALHTSNVHGFCHLAGPDIPDTFAFTSDEGVTVPWRDVTDFVPDESRPLPTREQVREVLGVAHLGPINGMVERQTDAIEALLRGESR